MFGGGFSHESCSWELSTSTTVVRNKSMWLHKSYNKKIVARKGTLNDPGNTPSTCRTASPPTIMSQLVVRHCWNGGVGTLAEVWQGHNCSPDVIGDRFELCADEVSTVQGNRSIVLLHQIQSHDSVQVQWDNSCKTPRPETHQKQPFISLEPR